MRKQGSKLHEATGVAPRAALVQHLQRHIEDAAALVDQALRPVGRGPSRAGTPLPPGRNPRIESRKRKRPSFLAPDDRDFVEQLSAPGTPTTDLLPLFHAELRHHQLQGVRWLHAMHSNGLCTALADESGHDRAMQLAGLLSLQRAKGLCGPFLIVTPARRCAHWAAALQQALGEAGVQVHAMQQAAPHSWAAVAALCSTPSQQLSGAMTVPPSVVIVVSDEILMAHPEALAQLGFCLLILDAAPGSPASSHDRGSAGGGGNARARGHPAAPGAPTPCASWTGGGGVGAELVPPHEQVSAGAGLPGMGVQQRVQGATGLASLAMHGGRRGSQAATGQSDASGRPGPSRHAPMPRRTGGPVTRSAAHTRVAAEGHPGPAGNGTGRPADASSHDVMEDEGHTELVLSLSRLSSSAGPMEELMQPDAVLSGNHEARGGPWAAIQPCPTVDRTPSCSSLHPAPSTAAATARPHTGMAATALCAPGSVVAPPPALVPAAGGPMGQAVCASTADVGARTHESAPCRAQGLSTPACSPLALEHAPGVGPVSRLVLTGPLLRAVQAVVPGPGNVLILAEGPLAEAAGLEELGCLLELLIPGGAPELQDAVRDALRAGALLPEPSAPEVWSRLRGLVSRFVLHRPAAAGSLEALRDQGPECNLYDLFAGAD